MSQMPNSSPTVALMDSHPLTLHGLTSLIKSISPACDIRMEETCLSKISEALMYQSVDLLVTDLQGTQENLYEGVDILLRLSTQFPDQDIIVYTFCRDGNELRKLLNQYNIHLISRGEPLTETKMYFKQAFAKKRVLSPLICSALANLSEKSHHLTSRLTRSENDVLKQLYNGMDLRKIAELKHLSIKTISAHKCNAMRKLNVKTDSELFLLLKNTFGC